MTDDEQIAEHDKFVAELRERWPWQFREATYLAVGPGWWPEIERVCEYADALLTDPRDRAIFRWCQIKEKLGGLRMSADTTVPVPLPDDDVEARAYVDLLRMHISPDRLSVRDEPGSLDAELTVHQGLRNQLWDRIREAARTCDRLCETCGAPGELYKTGWLTVLCPDHIQARKERENAG